MKELSLNILDVVENSVKAGATLTEIIIHEEDNLITLTIRDDGCGMPPEVVSAVTDPFYTTRTTRKVGMGIPLLKLAAEQTGGKLMVESIDSKTDPNHHGTTVIATFDPRHIDFTPLGDIIASLTTIIQGHPDTDFLFRHDTAKYTVELDTRELRQVLEGVPLNNYDVIQWIDAYLREQYGDPQA